MGAPRIGEDYSALRTELARILPEGVGYAVLDPRLPRPGMLYPVEAAAMTRAVPKRVNEFTAGRVAARQAMAMIGLRPATIPMGADRAPVWPEGVVGSISHCETACVAVAAPTTNIATIGIDVEEDTPLEHELWEEVCRPEELTWLMAQPEEMRGRIAKRIFSAKEAVHKAVWLKERRMLEYWEVMTSIQFNTSKADCLNGIHIHCQGATALFSEIIPVAIITSPNTYTNDCGSSAASNLRFASAVILRRASLSERYRSHTCGKSE